MIGKLINMIMRVAVWGAFGAGLGYGLVLAYELLFSGGALTYVSTHSGTGATIGGAIGGVIGFFRRN